MKVTWIIPVGLWAGLAMAAGDELPFLQPTTPYSGVRIIQTSEGELKQTVYWTEEKSRTETELPGMSMTNIVREDLGVMWISNPVMGGCLEQTLDDYKGTVIVVTHGSVADAHADRVIQLQSGRIVGS